MKKIENVILKPIFFVLMTIIFIIVGFSYFIFNGIVSSKFNNLINTVLISKQNEIEQFLINKIDEIDRLSYLYDSKLNLEENLYNLKKINDVTKEYESLGISDSEGNIKLTTGVSFNISNREYFKNFKDNNLDFVMSNVIVSKENDEKIVIFLKRLEENKILSAAININYINEVISLTDEFKFPIKIDDKNNNEVMKSGDISGINNVYESKIHKSPDWVLKIYVPITYFKMTQYIINFSLVLIAILSYFLTRSIIRKQIKKSITPINELSLKMSTIKNDFNEINIESDVYEIINLKDSYNKMINRINKLIEDIERSEKEKKDSDYQALLEQIKPHFLYNTLETIQSMAIDYDDDKLEKAISLLGRYFRLSLSGHSKFISISDEINLSKSYIELQKLRYGDKLNLIVTNNLDKEHMILKFTIQPLLENAIYHGIKQLDYKSDIELIIEEDIDNIIIKVVNDTNYDNEKILSAKNNLNYHDKLKGNGLYNVNERLKLHFNKECIDIFKENNKVVVLVKFPKIRGNI